MEIVDSRREPWICLVLTLLAVCAGYLLISAAGIWPVVHGASQKLVEMAFTGLGCYVRSTPDRYTNDPFRQEEYAEINCTALLIGDSNAVVGLAGYAGESIGAAILLVSPASAIGGVWFGLIGDRLLASEGTPGSEFAPKNRGLTTGAGILALLLCIAGVGMQYSFFKRYRGRNRPMTEADAVERVVSASNKQ